MTLRLFGGTARVDITPQEAVSMGGYGQRAGLLSQGVHDPLFAKALYLCDGESRLLMITTDLISIPNAIYTGVVKRLVEAGGVAESEICLAASHTHSAADVDESIVIAAPNQQYIGWLVERLVQVGRAAASQSIPLSLKLAVGTADFLVNRRQKGENATRDERILALQVNCLEDAKPLAVLFGVGCHAVCLGYDNLLISADYPGVAQRFIEQQLGVENALFVNLAEGNIIPHSRPPLDSLDPRGYQGGTFSDAEAVGMALGRQVLACLDGAPSETQARLRVNQRQVMVKPTHSETSWLAAWKPLLAQRKIILEYLPEFRRASPLQLKPVFTLWRDASQVVIEHNLSESEMRRLMSAVSSFLMLAMKLANPALRKRYPLAVQTIEIDDFRLLALPGEALVEVSQHWQQLNTPHQATAFVISLANGYLGYLPHPDNFLEDNATFKYETIMNALEREATRLALHQAQQMIQS